MFHPRRRLEHRRVGCKNACSSLEEGWSIAELAVMVVGLGGGDRGDVYMVLSRFTFTDRPSLDKERFKFKHVGCWGYLLA